MFKDIGKPFKRAKVISGVAGTLLGGYRAATKIDGWKEPRRDILPKYIQVFCRSAAGAFGVDIVEVEPIPKTHALWVSNHISWMDIPVVGSVSPAFFLSKAEVVKLPIFGPLAKVAGTLFIQRGSGDAGSVASQMADFLREGYSIIFFPEGTTTDGTKVKRVHGRLLQAAIDTDIPIQPMVICYLNEKGELDDQVPYFGGIGLKESLFKVMDSKPITAYVMPLEPILPEGRPFRELTKVLQERMDKGLAELHDRVMNKELHDRVMNK